MRRKWIFIVPLAIAGDGAVHLHRRRSRAACCGTGCCRRSSAGPQITFWQALGLLALCRILFGGFGLQVEARVRSHAPRMADRMADRMAERWEHMTPEERERFRQRMRERCGFDPSAGESQSR